MKMSLCFLTSLLLEISTFSALLIDAVPRYEQTPFIVPATLLSQAFQMSKNQPQSLPAANSSSDEVCCTSNGNLSSADSGEVEVVDRGVSTLLNPRSALSAEAQDFILASSIGENDTFAYQLSHLSPQRNIFITRGTQSRRPSQSSASGEVNHASVSVLNSCTSEIQPFPLLNFLPSSSSTSYTLAGLPVVTFAETLLHSATASFAADTSNSNIDTIDTIALTSTPKRKVGYYIPYLQLGYLELTDDVISRICPCDLVGLPCPHDEVFEWNWIDGNWECAGVGCGMLRLCEVCSLLVVSSSGSSLDGNKALRPLPFRCNIL